MDPLIAAVITGLGTTLVSIMVAVVTFAWKMGQWHTEAKALHQRLDDFMERTEASITDAHKRIDRILDSH